MHFHRNRPCSRVCRRRKGSGQYILHFRKKVCRKDRWAHQFSVWASPYEALYTLFEENVYYKWKEKETLIDILRSSLSQLLTLAFQSQVWRSTSKAKPAGQRTAAKRIAPAIPARSHRTTSRQSPSVERRKYSSGGRFSQSCSGVWAPSLAWRVTRSSLWAPVPQLYNM